MSGQQVLQCGNDDRARQDGQRVDHGSESGGARAQSHAEPDDGDQDGEEELCADNFGGDGQNEHSNRRQRCHASSGDQLSSSQLDIGHLDLASPYHSRRDSEREPVRQGEAECNSPDECHHVGGCLRALQIAINEAMRQIET